jgi:hypothetical protein
LHHLLGAEVAVGSATLQAHELLVQHIRLDHERGLRVVLFAQVAHAPGSLILRFKRINITLVVALIVPPTKVTLPAVAEVLGRSRGGALLRQTLALRAVTNVFDFVSATTQIQNMLKFFHGEVINVSGQVNSVARWGEMSHGGLSKLREAMGLPLLGCWIDVFPRVKRVRDLFCFFLRIAVEALWLRRELFQTAHESRSRFARTLFWYVNCVVLFTLT